MVSSHILCYVGKEKSSIQNKQRNVASPEMRGHNKELESVWSMDLELRREALALCGDM